jgi:hypothetical protein
MQFGDETWGNIKISKDTGQLWGDKNSHLERTLCCTLTSTKRHASRFLLLTFVSNDSYAHVDTSAGSLNSRLSVPSTI